MIKIPQGVVFGLLMVCSSAGVFGAPEYENTIWIDVRSVREYQQGHVEGAINIPHGDIAYKIMQLVPDTYTEIHLYCGTGAFAGLALEILMELGYQAVVNEGAYQVILSRQKAD